MRRGSVELRTARGRGYEELTMWFDVIATPALVHEIISNLRKTSPVKKGRHQDHRLLQV